VKHFQGLPREQARGRIVAPHLALASVRASRPLAQRAPAVLSEPSGSNRTKPSVAILYKLYGAAVLIRGGSLYSHARGIVYRRGCGRWKCTPCTRRNAAVVRERFKRIFWRCVPAMVTLTAATADDADPTPAAMRTFARRVASFRRWVTRHYGFFQWAWVREVAERESRCVCHAALACRCGAGGGRLHVHMLCDAPYVPQRALSAAAMRSGLGPVLDVRRAAAGARQATSPSIWSNWASIRPLSALAADASRCARGGLRARNPIGATIRGGPRWSRSKNWAATRSIGIPEDGALMNQEKRAAQHQPVRVGEFEARRRADSSNRCPNFKA